MDWLTGSKQGDIKRLVSQLADPQRRESAARQLIERGEESLPALLELLHDADDSLVRIAQEILARIPAAAPQLVRVLGGGHPLLRGRAAEVFALSRDRSAVPSLLEALKGDFFTVRARAAEALGQIGDPACLPHVLPLLKDAEVEVRLAACRALEAIGDASAYGELSDVLLGDPMIEVRQAAARALAARKHPAAVPYLMEALRDSFWWYEREQAARDLLRLIEGIGPPVVDPLIAALAEREATVRKFAAIILGNLGDPRAYEELGMAIFDLHHEVSAAACLALGRAGAAGFEYLAAAGTHEEPGIRESALLGLGEIQDDRTTSLLVERLDDPVESVQKQAVRSLGRQTSALARETLQRLASDRTNRRLAALAQEILASSSSPKSR